MRRAAVLLTAALLSLTGACAARGVGEQAVRPSTSRPGETTLTITVEVSESGGEHRSYTLRCDPPRGSVPDPAGACAALLKAPDPLRPVSRGTSCTEIYGGSAAATVVGVRDGAAVHSRFSRVNGCEIDRWEAAGPLLPGPVPGQPAPSG